MTSSVAIIAATPDEPTATTSRTPTTPPERDDNGGGSFNAHLTEQTARALEATHRNAADTTKRDKRAPRKSDAVSAAQEPVSNVVANPTVVTGTHVEDRAQILAAGLNPGALLSSSGGEDGDGSSAATGTASTTPATSTAPATSTTSTTVLPTSLQRAESDVEGATSEPLGDSSLAVEARGSEESDSTTTPGVVDVSTTEESQPLDALTLGTIATVRSTSDHVGGDVATSVSVGASDEAASSSVASSLVAPASKLLSGAELPARGAVSTTTSDALSSAPGARGENSSPPTTTPESSSLTLPTRHSEAARVTGAVADDLAPTTFVSSARTVTATASNATPEDASTSPLDVMDLATSISQAALGADGSYTLNVAMHPSDLGHVQAVVSLNGEDLHVAITPQTPAGHAALSNAVDALKSELSRGGLNVNVSLRDPESRSGGSGDELPRGASADENVADEGEEVAPNESLAAGQIHLIL